MCCSHPNLRQFNRDYDDEPADGGWGFPKAICENPNGLTAIPHIIKG